MKKFKDIKVGDRIYTASIADSVLKQDCVGNVIIDYCVSDASIFNDECVIKLQKMRYVYKQGYVKDDSIGNVNNEVYIYPKLNDSIITKPLLEKENNKYGLLINKMIFSTTKRDLFNELTNIISENSKKIEEVIETAKKVSLKSISMNLLLNNSLNMTVFEPEEKEITEEEFACMAL